MRRSCLALAAAIAAFTAVGLAQQPPTAGPYSVLKTAKVGGLGGFDYLYADVTGRRLYIPRGVRAVGEPAGNAGAADDGDSQCRHRHDHHDAAELVHDPAGREVTAKPPAGGCLYMPPASLPSMRAISRGKSVLFGNCWRSSSRRPRARFSCPSREWYTARRILA